MIFNPKSVRGYWMHPKRTTHEWAVCKYVNYVDVSRPEDEHQLYCLYSIDMWGMSPMECYNWIYTRDIMEFPRNIKNPALKIFILKVPFYSRRVEIKWRANVQL